MLHAMLEIVLSLLAVLGLLALGWMLFGRLLAPRSYYAPVFAVIPARGDGESLEQTVKSLLWLRSGDLERYTVVIADAGLSSDGAAVAQRLAQREPGILLCRLGELDAFLLRPRR